MDETITRQIDPRGVAQSSQLFRMSNFNVSAAALCRNGCHGCFEEYYHVCSFKAPRAEYLQTHSE